MADQSNPWDTATAADRAAQSADGAPRQHLPMAVARRTGSTAHLRLRQNTSTLWIRSIKR